MTKSCDYRVPLAYLQPGAEFRYLPPDEAHVYVLFSMVGPHNPGEEFLPVKPKDKDLIYFEDAVKMIFPAEGSSVKPEMFEYLEVFDRWTAPLPGFVLVCPCPEEIKHLGVHRAEIWRRPRAFEFSVSCDNPTQTQ